MLTLIATAALASSPLEALLTNVPGESGGISEPDVSRIGNLRLTRRSCTSSKTAAELKRHFTAAFETVGLSLTEPALSDVSGFDPKSQIGYTADLVTTGPATQITVSAYEVDGNNVAPLYPGATHVSWCRLETSYRVAASAQAVESFYWDTLKSEGWAELRPMVFVKGSRQLFVDATELGSETSVQIQLRTYAP